MFGYHVFLALLNSAWKLKQNEYNAGAYPGEPPWVNKGRKKKKKKKKKEVKGEREKKKEGNKAKKKKEREVN